MSTPSDALTPRQWLADQPHDASRYLYVVLGNTSDADPLPTYYRQADAAPLLPIWEGTPYAGWQEVMPFLGELRADSLFLDWIEQQTERDWGWLAISPYPATVVRDWLRSLTQVRMPDGSEVFFRYWDGRHLAPILTHLSGTAGDLLPVFERYWINGRDLTVELPVLGPSRPYPWWDVPPDLLAKLSAEDPAPLVDNLMQWLRETHPDLYFAFPETNLRLKTEHFMRHATYTEDTLAGLFKAHLEKELSL
ncbi:DUF4123 domain-containing protein [Pseudomonas indica]|uniref:DUF4123 domain-containing protein n=1 Tax=Pseudomonas indica TaxID=137658 RepID=A0A1G9PVS2_9PSED|nr:DUF4123 domain-containing protein [Pseudomonas indica]SDM02892.1 protein of unknown function [Pseudomonas indica]